MRSIYGTDAKGKTTVVGEMDESMLVGAIAGECDTGKKKQEVSGEMKGKGKKKKKADTNTFEARKAKLVTKKPGKATPVGDEDAITDPDNETPVGVGNTAKDKKSGKGKKAGECAAGGKKKK